jgi:Ribbon-helix-helix protein, copG family
MTNRIKKLLDKKKEEANEVDIVRGAGFQFSDEVAIPNDATKVSREPTPTRVSVRIRQDLAKKCKKLAVDLDTSMAELIEQFVEEGLEKLSHK